MSYNFQIQPRGNVDYHYDNVYDTGTTQTFYDIVVNGSFDLGTTDIVANSLSDGTATLTGGALSGVTTGTFSGNVETNGSGIGGFNIDSAGFALFYADRGDSVSYSNGLRFLTAGVFQGEIVMPIGSSDEIVFHNSGLNEKFVVNLTSGAVTMSGALSGVTNADFSGNVGIGTSSPDAKLTAYSGSFNSTVATFTGANLGRGLKIATYSRASNDDSVRLSTPYSGIGNMAFAVYNTDVLTLNSDYSATIHNNLSVGGASIYTSSTLTIATGAITVAKTFHRINTEAAAASDDLDTITAGTDGQVVILTSASATNDVVVRDNATGGGNIYLDGTTSFTLSHPRDRIVLMYDGAWSAWVEISRSNNGA